MELSTVFATFDMCMATPIEAGESEHLCHRLTVEHATIKLRWQEDTLLFFEMTTITATYRPTYACNTQGRVNLVYMYKTHGC